jgi:ribosomal-protein-alanine N-acetyltransferase
MILTPAGAKDAADLSACHRRSFEPAWSADDIEALLSAPGGHALAVRDPDDQASVRGFLLARAVAGEAEVLTLAVDPSHRRQGLAIALIEAAIGASIAAGAEAMFLEVAPLYFSRIRTDRRAPRLLRPPRPTGRRPGPAPNA